MERFWLGTAPKECDVCTRPLIRTFVDGKTADGRWGIMCPSCRIEQGREKLGTGLGQKYERQGDGRWLKTAG